MAGFAGELVRTANSSETLRGIDLTVYGGFPSGTLRLSIVANGETDLSLIGRCPASSHAKARQLSPFSERKARWLG